MKKIVLEESTRDYFWKYPSLNMTPPEPLTVAYLSVGAYSVFTTLTPMELKNLEMYHDDSTEIIEKIIQHAANLDQFWDAYHAQLDGLHFYKEICMPFGRELVRAMKDKHWESIDAKRILRDMLQEPLCTDIFADHPSV